MLNNMSAKIQVNLYSIDHLILNNISKLFKLFGKISTTISEVVSMAIVVSSLRPLMVSTFSTRKVELMEMAVHTFIFM